MIQPTSPSAYGSRCCRCGGESVFLRGEATVYRSPDGHVQALKDVAQEYKGGVPPRSLTATWNIALCEPCAEKLLALDIRGELFQAAGCFLPLSAIAASAAFASGMALFQIGGVLMLVVVIALILRNATRLANTRIKKRKPSFWKDNTEYVCISMSQQILAARKKAPTQSIGEKFFGDFPMP